MTDLTKAKVRQDLMNDYEYLDKQQRQKETNIKDVQDMVEAEVIKRQKDQRARELDRLDEE